MRTERGFARLVGFSDGVVAIAITLLILPLVTSVADTRGDLTEYLAENAFQLFAFVLSFAVIARFWLVHHQLYENLIGYNPALLWANMLWLLSIVFLPFPTELIATGTGDDALRSALYVGTMVVTTLAALMQQVIVIRHPELQAPEVRGTLRLLPYVTATIALLVALGVSIALPGLGLLSLALLAVLSPIERLIDRIRKRTP
jgi:uncharacterized membrane protein